MHKEKLLTVFQPPWTAYNSTARDLTSPSPICAGIAAWLTLLSLVQITTTIVVMRLTKKETWICSFLLKDYLWFTDLNVSLFLSSVSPMMKIHMELTDTHLLVIPYHHFNVCCSDKESPSCLIGLVIFMLAPLSPFLGSINQLIRLWEYHPLTPVNISSLTEISNFYSVVSFYWFFCSYVWLHFPISYRIKYFSWSQIIQV